MAAELADFFRDSMMETRDRHARNAVTFEELLRTDHVGSAHFRQALAYRTASESGGGQSRAQTQLPGPFPEK